MTMNIQCFPVLIALCLGTGYTTNPLTANAIHSNITNQISQITPTTAKDFWKEVTKKR